MLFAIWLFGVMLCIIFYTYIGYGLVLWCLVKIKSYFFPIKPNPARAVELPEVTLFITAYNEERIVEEKMQNSFNLNYPKEKLTIFWVTDGSTDNTVDKLKAYSNIRILHQSERGGKTAAINRGMTYVTTPITIFTDANTMIHPDSIMHMVKKLNDPHVGCVAGEKRVESKAVDSAVGGEGVYWRYESLLKELDSKLYSTVGAAGELFAIKTSLYEVMPSDTLLDDFMLSMRIAQKGYKISYCKDAYAIEERSKNITEERKRKVRIAAGGLQAVIRLKTLLNPFKYGWLSFQFFSHRLLRWTITPITLFSLIPLNLALIFLRAEPASLFQVIALLQFLFYSLSVMGWIRADKPTSHKLFFIPYYFTFMNLCVIKGFTYFWKRKNQPAVWEKAERF